MTATPTTRTLSRDALAERVGQLTRVRFAHLPTPLEEARPSLEQGLTLTFSQGGKTDVRPARLLSLYVPESHSPTPFLSAGPFTATWSGFLNQRLRNEVTFSVLGRGKILVKVGGNVTTGEGVNEGVKDGGTSSVGSIVSSGVT